MMNVSTRIKELRKEKDLKQQQLADYLGISQQSYSHYEQNKRELPVRHIVKLSKFYNVSTDYLLGTSPRRFGTFDLNSNFIQDVSLKTLLSILNRLSPNSRQELIRFLSYLDAAPKK